MFRKYTFALTMVLGVLLMSAASVPAQHLPQPPAYSVPAVNNCCWNERTFMIALRARMFANSMERQGYIVQLHRVGLFNWCVRYRSA